MLPVTTLSYRWGQAELAYPRDSVAWPFAGSIDTGFHSLTTIHFQAVALPRPQRAV